MEKRYLLGVFDDDEVVLQATRHFKHEGVKVDDVMSPFPIHGIDPALGLRDTRLHTAGFIFGFVGCILILSFIIWINTSNYPTIYGGKPYLSLPAYIPVTFEFTVLCAAVGMVIAFFLRGGLSAISQKPVLDLRITNDKFVMVFDTHDLTAKEVSEISSMLWDRGAIEVNEKLVEE